MQKSYKRAFKARTGSPASIIIKFLTERGEATQGAIMAALLSHSAYTIHECAIWRAVSYMFGRGVITRELKFNPYTKRMAFHYTLAQK